MHRRSFLIGAALVACSRSANTHSGASSPWPADHVVSGEDLAREVTAPGARPRVMHVGPAVLFKRAHVPTAIHAGEGGEPDGLAEITTALAPLAHDTDLVLYCGCCPYKNCPNIRPAYSKAVELGFTRVRVLDLPTNLKTDWSDHGLPVETG